MKTKYSDVIGVNVFPHKLMRFRRKKGVTVPTLMHLSNVLNRLLFSINGRAGHWRGTGGHITNNNLLLHFSGHNNDLLVLKQWKGPLNRIMLSPLGLLKNNDLALRARSLFIRRPRSSGIILYLMDYAIAQTVTLYRVFRDFIHLCSLFFFFFYERKGVARSRVTH